MAFKGKQYTITATAASLTSILGERLWCRQIKLRNATGALNPLYVGPSTVTNAPANAYLQITAGVTEDFSGWPTNSLNTDEIFLVGTANAANIAYIVIVT